MGKTTSYRTPPNPTPKMVTARGDKAYAVKEAKAEKAREPKKKWK